MQELSLNSPAKRGIRAGSLIESQGEEMRDSSASGGPRLEVRYRPDDDEVQI